MKIIGIAGTNGSGKDTIGNLLRDKYGWCFAVATDMLRDELVRQGKETSRANKSALSAEWRRQYGMAAIVDIGVEMYQDGHYTGLIVGSLRHPGEADKVHELGGTMIWVDADPEVRYARIRSADRNRGAEDDLTFEQWQADEYREMHPEGDGATLNGAAVKERADVYIYNNGTDIADFVADIEQQLQAFLS